MSDFWNSPLGEITGKPEDSFTKDFSIIPDQTIAEAVIKKFVLVEKENKYENTLDKYYEITYKLINGDYKNREVTQKIKVFHGTPESVHRNLNMFKLILSLCDFKPTHRNEPTDLELIMTTGKTICVKIREWSMPKKDGTGIMEGNFVSEVYKSGDMPTETGIKLPVVEVKGVPSALTRNSSLPYSDDSLPF